MNKEENRLSDLYKYGILDNPPEEELDDLAQLTADICDTPVSLISFIDTDRQWYKAKVGIDIREYSIKNSFCQFLLNNPNDLLVVEEPFSDQRFYNNPFVTQMNGIRFYAGAPLVSNRGNVIGTVCVFDFVTKRFTEKQRLALKLISKKVMRHLEIRRKLKSQEQEIELSATRLKKLTDLAPGAIFQLLADETGKMKFVFLSNGIKDLVRNNRLKEIKKDPQLILDLLHPEDKAYVIQSFQESFQNNIPPDLEYRIIKSDKSVVWHWLKANPERRNDGIVVWYGTIQNISQKKRHLETLEQMLFDLSHVIRKPTANILGCIDILKKGETNNKESKELIDLIQSQTNNLERYIRNLNSDYLTLKIALDRKGN